MTGLDPRNGLEPASRAFLVSGSASGNRAGARKRNVPIPDLTPIQRERFWSKVDMTAGLDECWPWLGARSDNGPGAYGRVMLTGRHFTAHRVAYKLAIGIDPADATVEHACGRSDCMNPFTMILMSAAKNVMAPSSNAVGRVNRDKTSCKHGHEFTDANTYVGVTTRGEVYRACRACAAAATRARYHTRGAKRSAARQR